jgi:MFS family permease
MKSSWSIPLIATIGSLIMGYEIGVIGTALLLIAKDLIIKPMMVSAIASIIIPGTLIGVLGATTLKYPAKTLFQLNAVIFILSLILQALASSSLLLLLGRFILGLAIGISLVQIPKYLAEIAPIPIRGRYLTIFQLSITLGILSGYLVSFFIAPFSNWRLLLVSALPLALLQLLFSPSLPDSHYQSDKIHLRSPTSIWRQSTVVKALLAGNALAILHQFTGITAITFFAPQILMSLYAHSSQTAIFGGILLALANFIATFLAIFSFDIFGRKRVLSVSFLLQTLSLASLALVNYLNITQPYLMVSLLILYIMSYAIGVGPGMWLLLAEMYPLAIRSKAITISVFINNIAAFTVLTLFLVWMAKIGNSLLFFLFSLFALCGLLLVSFLPETKHKSLSEIDNEYRVS